MSNSNQTACVIMYTLLIETREDLFKTYTPLLSSIVKMNILSLLKQNTLSFWHSY